MADFTTTDPLGNRITQQDTTWFGHIADGHADVLPHRQEVELALQWPSVIKRSVRNPDRRDYVRALQSEPGYQIAVVADIVEGLVVTAFRIRVGQFIPGEEVWP